MWWGCLFQGEVDSENSVRAPNPYWFTSNEWRSLANKSGVDQLWHRSLILHLQKLHQHIKLATTAMGFAKNWLKGNSTCNLYNSNHHHYDNSSNSNKYLSISLTKIGILDSCFFHIPHIVQLYTEQRKGRREAHGVYSSSPPLNCGPV